MNVPRLMIAGTHSGAGKTTITTAIMGALAGQGLRVQPYKVGPDYIDTSYHTMATGNPSRNLDAWMMSEETVCRLFARSAAGADVAVIEGVMGLFDGSSGTSEQGSSAHIAKLLNCPVILIIDARSMARSAAAMVLGYKNFDPGLNVAGVIVNRIGSERHLNLVREAIEKYCDVPVVGYVRKKARLELPSRHLGLVPTVEGGDLVPQVRALAQEIEDGIDLAGIMEIARTAGEMSCTGELAAHCKSGSGKENSQRQEPSVNIGIARDEAFSFYYQDGLEVLESCGASLVPFSPLHDRELPAEIDGIYIGGGFPELFLPQLAANSGMLRAIREAGRNGMPVYAECGGLMYLTEAIVDLEEKKIPMVGLVPAQCVMGKKLAGMGYVKATAASDNILAPAGGTVRGHEFHYSHLVPRLPRQPAFQVTKNRSGETGADGFAANNIVASYVHLHFAGCPETAGRFVQSCRDYRAKTRM